MPKTKPSTITEDKPPVMIGDKCHCRRCDHRWEARVDNPQRCPCCTAYQWDRPARPGNYRRSGIITPSVINKIKQG